MKKKLAAAGVALTLAGSGAGLALLGPSIAGAADSGSSSESTATADAARPGASGEGIADALAPLVDDGTLTQAQSDAVAEALEAARPERPRGPRGRRAGLEATAPALGIDAATLRSELRSGKTIADVAGENGVDVQHVVDAIVADMQRHLAEAVENGHLTQEQADERAAEATERATAIVNGEMPDRPGGPGPAPDDESPDSSTT